MEENMQTNSEVNTVNTNIEQSTNENDNQSQIVENQGQASTETNSKPQEDFFSGEKVAKAFSQRLNKEREKLTAQYQPYEKVLDIAAKEFGMSREDYIKQILEQYSGEASEEIDTKENNKQKSEKDLLLEQLLEERKSKEIEENWNKQTQELLKINDSLKPEDISDEMLIESQEKGIPLHYLYAYNLLTSGRESFEKTIREKAIADIQKLNSSSAGSMKSGSTNIGSVKISDMSAKDFNELKQKVLRGEIKSI